MQYLKRALSYTSNEQSDEQKVAENSAHKIEFEIRQEMLIMDSLSFPVFFQFCIIFHKYARYYEIDQIKRKTYIFFIHSFKLCMLSVLLLGF